MSVTITHTQVYTLDDEQLDELMLGGRSLDEWEPEMSFIAVDQSEYQDYAAWKA